MANIFFQIINKEGKTYIERLIYPRFKAEITFSTGVSDLENIVMIDQCNDPVIMAKAMREAGDYIVENSR